MLMDAQAFEGNPAGGSRLLRVNGAYFISLSSNDYALGQFLFGKVNGNRGRNLPRAAIMKNLWKARIEEQKRLANEIMQSQAEVATDDDQNEILNTFSGTKPRPSYRQKAIVPGSRTPITAAQKQRAGCVRHWRWYPRHLELPCLLLSKGSTL